MDQIAITTGLLVALVAAFIVDLILRGFALWLAAKNGDSIWFVIILIATTAGVVPAIYIIFFSRKKITEINKI